MADEFTRAQLRQALENAKNEAEDSSVFTQNATKASVIQNLEERIDASFDSEPVTTEELTIGRQRAVDANADQSVLDEIDSRMAEIVQRDRGGNILNAINKGILAGFDDEILGGLEAALAFVLPESAGGAPEGQTFDELFITERDQIRADKESFAARNPKTSTVAEVAGALAGPGKLATPALKAGGLGLKNLAVVGAAEGSLFAMGSADIPERPAVEGVNGRQDRAESGGFLSLETGIKGLGGAVEGALFAPIAVTAGRIGLNVAGRVKDFVQKLRGLGPEVDPQAVKIAAKAFSKDNIDAPELTEKLANLGEEGLPADVGGKSVKSLTDVAFQRAGKAGQEAEQNLIRRQQGRLTRVEKDIKAQVGDFDNYIAKVDDVIQDMKQTAAPLYEEAFSNTDKVGGDRLLSILANEEGKLKPRVSAAWNAARKNIEDETGEVLPKVLDVSEGLNVKTIDQLKRGFDSVIEKNTSDFGKVNEVGRIVLRLKTEMLKIADEANPSYSAAREAFSDGASHVRALRDGLKFLRQDADEIARDISNMTLTEQQMFQQGAAKSLRQRIATAADGADTKKRLFGNDAIREKIEMVIGTGKQFDVFEEAMEREAAFSRTRRALQGSPTQPRQQADAQLVADAASVGANVASGNPVTTGLSIIKSVLNFSERSAARKADDITKILLGRDVKVRNQLIKELQNISGALPPSDISIIAAAIAVTAAGKATAEPLPENGDE